jgi:hypothetical protein
VKDYHFVHLSGAFSLALSYLCIERPKRSAGLLTLGPSSPLSFPAGDLLRAEQERPESQYGAMIKEYITEGKIVPMEITVKVSRESVR